MPNTHFIPQVIAEAALFLKMNKRHALVSTTLMVVAFVLFFLADNYFETSLRLRVLRNGVGCYLISLAALIWIDLCHRTGRSTPIKAQLKSIHSHLPIFIMSLIFYALSIFSGTILLIFPGVWAATAFILGPVFAVESYGIVPAFRQSAQLVNQAGWLKVTGCFALPALSHVIVWLGSTLLWSDELTRSPELIEWVSLICLVVFWPLYGAVWAGLSGVLYQRA